METSHGMAIRRFGSGPEMVWIHGLGESSLGFDAIAHRFAGFTHVLPDLPGYGRSAARVMSLDALADHLVAWLVERPPAIVIGHSMGGVLATLIAERTAVRAVIDIDGNLTRGDCTFSAEAGKYSAAEFADHGFAVLRDEVYRRGVTELPLRGYHAAMSFTDPATFHLHSADLVAMSERADLVKRHAALRVPMLFIAGVPGGICEASRAEMDREHVRWVGIAPSGHWPHQDRPDDFVAAVTAFIRDLG